MTQMVLTKKSFVLAEDMDLLRLKYIFFDTKGSELHP